MKLLSPKLELQVEGSGISGTRIGDVQRAFRRVDRSNSNKSGSVGASGKRRGLSGARPTNLFGRVTRVRLNSPKSTHPITLIIATTDDRV